MITISERNRARLAERLLSEPREPQAGDYVLVWLRVDDCMPSGQLLVTWDAEVSERAYVINRGLLERSSVVLATPEAPA